MISIKRQRSSSSLIASLNVRGIEKHSLRVGCGTFGIRSTSAELGAPIVFIHGWMHSSLIWDRIPQELVAKRSIVLIDLPGFGHESLVRQAASLEEVGADLHEVLHNLDAEMGISTIVADSLGGVLFLLGANDPKWLHNKEVFLSGVPFDGLPRIFHRLPVSSLIPTAVRLIKAMPRFIGEALVKLNIWFTAQLQSTVGDEIYASVLATDPTAAVHFFRLLQRPMNRSQLVNRLKFTKRAILVRGQFDRIVSRDTNNVWADIISAEHCDIPGAGHTPMIETAKYYYKAVSTMSC